MRMNMNIQNVNRHQDKYKQYIMMHILKRKLLMKKREKQIFTYNPSYHNKKILMLVATHTNTHLKMMNIKSNLYYLKNECIDIVVVNSKGLAFNEEMKKYYENINIQYFEIENDATFDFGKWVYLLNNIDYTKYDYVIFKNDSFIMHSTIPHFINLTIKKNKELYGYNDSSQSRYHYQSYLFSLRADVVYKLMNFFNENKNKIHNQNDVVQNFELVLTDLFQNNDCYLKIANLSIHQGKNIFFDNDFLYKALKINRLLPFTKIKRLLQR